MRNASNLKDDRPEEKVKPLNRFVGTTVDKCFEQSQKLGHEWSSVELLTIMNNGNEQQLVNDEGATFVQDEADWNRYSWTQMGA
jgi:hypothetical protein